MVVRFHCTPRTHHHRCSAPAKLLIVLLLLLHNAQSKRPASNKLRPSFQASHPAQTEPRPTELQVAEYNDHRFKHVTMAHYSSYSSKAGRRRHSKCNSTCPSRLGRIFIDRLKPASFTAHSHGKIHLPTDCHPYTISIQSDDDVQPNFAPYFLLLYIFSLPAVVPACSRGEQSRTALSFHSLLISRTSCTSFSLEQFFAHRFCIR